MVEKVKFGSKYFAIPIARQISAHFHLLLLERVGPLNPISGANIGRFDIANFTSLAAAV